MEFTNIGLLEHCKNAPFKTVYMWGTYGLSLTEKYLKAKIKQYPLRYSAKRKEYLYEKIDKDYRCCDCVGLVKSYFFGGWDNIKYNSDYDKNVSGYKKLCGKTYPISDIPKTKGLLVFMTGHLGVYDGDGGVYQCTLNTDKNIDGFIHTKLSDQKWTDYGYLPITYIDDKKSTVNELCEKIKEAQNVITECTNELKGMIM